MEQQRLPQNQANQKDLQNQLRNIFEIYGKINLLVVKKNINAGYSFAFVQYNHGCDGQKIIQKLNGKKIKGKQMKVQLQDNTKRRKDTDKCCYNCGKKGHFLRDCRFDKNNSKGLHARSRSPTPSKNGHKTVNRSASISSDQDRSRTKRKKAKKDKQHDRSHDRSDKKKKKHKKRKSSSNSS